MQMTGTLGTVVYHGIQAVNVHKAFSRQWKKIDLLASIRAGFHGMKLHLPVEGWLLNLLQNTLASGLLSNTHKSDYSLLCQ